MMPGIDWNEKLTDSTATAEVAASVPRKSPVRLRPTTAEAARREELLAERIEAQARSLLTLRRFVGTALFAAAVLAFCFGMLVGSRI